MDRGHHHRGVASHILSPLLAALALLAGCTGNSPAPQPPTRPAEPPAAHIALLAPLASGAPNAAPGQALLRAAQLALAAPDPAHPAPILTAHDTTADPAAAARAAIAAGARVIIGPLTTAETAAAAPIAAAARVPMLSFTSDATRSAPGVWVMGITPAEQVARLVAAARARGRSRFAALLPAGALGDALATGLAGAAANEGLPPPTIARYASAAELPAAIASLTGAPPAEGDTPPPPPPPPFDALLLGEAGNPLAAMLPGLVAAGITPARVLLLGPASWAPAGGPSNGPIGGWYAVPPPAARVAFERAYRRRAGAAAPFLSELGFDAAGIDRLAAGATDPAAILTRREGYLGANGTMVLLPDGQVRRGLAVYAVDRNGAHLVEPARTPR